MKPDTLRTRSAAQTIVLGFPYTNLDYEGVVEKTAGWIDVRAHRFVIAAPVSSLIMARRSKEVESAFRDGALMTADGIPIVWAQKLLGHAGATRVYGPTLMLHVLKRAEAERWKVGLYGGHEDRLPVLVKRLQEMHPTIDIAYAFSPPFRDLGDSEADQIVADINSAGVQVLFVGLGAPKQELWMQEFSRQIPAVMFGVGAAFDFHAGFVPQAPPLLQRLGLEWAYRLSKEPKRLWRRYATTIPPFLWAIGKEIAVSKLRGIEHQVQPHEDSGLNTVGSGTAGPTGASHTG